MKGVVYKYISNGRKRAHPRRINFDENEIDQKIVELTMQGKYRRTIMELTGDTYHQIARRQKKAQVSSRQWAASCATFDNYIVGLRKRIDASLATIQHLRRMGLVGNKKKKKRKYNK